jgi:hypothetical protein
MILAGPYLLEYPIKNLFYFLQVNVRNLGIISYREFADLPHDLGRPILFIHDKIVQLKKEGDSETAIHKLLKSETSMVYIIRQEEKYWGYETAENYYLENLNK